MPVRAPNRTTAALRAERPVALMGPGAPSGRLADLAIVRDLALPFCTRRSDAVRKRSLTSVHGVKNVGADVLAGDPGDGRSAEDRLERV